VPISAGVSNIKAGKLRALATSTAKRSPLMPELPTTAEAGVKGADFGLWFGLWGPAGMPADLVNKISADVRRALADAEVRQRLINTGSAPMDMSSADFAKFVRSEIEDAKKIAAAAGIKPQ
jgi:tripartite-type tricarboxylate transporter receptor subunit TctC